MLWHISSGKFLTHNPSSRMPSSLVQVHNVMMLRCRDNTHVCATWVEPQGSWTRESTGDEEVEVIHAHWRRILASQRLVELLFVERKIEFSLVECSLVDLCLSVFIRWALVFNLWLEDRWGSSTSHRMSARGAMMRQDKKISERGKDIT